MRYLFTLVLLAFGVLLKAQDASPKRFGMQEEDLPKGLNVGDVAPDIALKDHNGEAFNLSKALKKGPVVVSFYRGNWCPYCSRYLSGLNDSIGLIVDKNASFIAISPEKQVNIKKSSEGLSKHIKVLSDVDGEIMKLYDVDFRVSQKYQKRVQSGLNIDLKEFNGQEEAVLPVPATYVINMEGKIIYKYFDINYSKRASVKSILQALSIKNLKS